MWENRIIGSGVKPAAEFSPNKQNPRKHPDKQKRAVKASLDTLGWIAPVIVLQDGTLLDGHERVEQALKKGDSTPVPYVQVDLNEDEARQALATFDFITYLAEYDRNILGDLINKIQTDSEDMQNLLDDIATSAGAVLPGDSDWSAVLGELPEGDRDHYQQMTFTLQDEQAETIREAIKIAHTMGSYDYENENGNGNALTRICEVFITQNGKS